MSTVVFQVTADTLMLTATPWSTVQAACSADRGIVELMLMSRLTVVLAASRYLTEHETVEFHMYLADHQGLTQSLGLLFLKRNKSKRS